MNTDWPLTLVTLLAGTLMFYNSIRWYDWVTYLGATPILIIGVMALLIPDFWREEAEGGAAA